MKYDVVFVFGVGRCGSGFTSTVLSLHPDILLFAGPPFGYLRESKKKVFTFDDLKSNWKVNPELEFEQNINKKEGYEKYYEYLKNKQKENGIINIWDNRGECHYSSLLNRIQGRHLMLYCARPIIDHCRSFKRFFGQQAGGRYFLDHLQRSLQSIKEAKGVDIVILNVCPKSPEEKITIFEKIHNIIGFTMTDLQRDFVMENRRIGGVREEKNNYSDAEIMSEINYNKNPLVLDYEKLLEEAL